MYSDRLADVYDVTFAHRDYSGEACRLAALVRARRPAAASLLDVGCGTGVHLGHLADVFDHVAGLDLSAAMLAAARRRLDGRSIPLHEADMTDFDLGRRFDAVVCMFGAIGYVRTGPALRSAAARMAAHLHPGGVLVLEPFHGPGTFGAHGHHTVVARDGDRTVMTLIVNRHGGTEGVMSMHHTYADGDDVEVFADDHHIGLFTDTEYRAALESAGLAVERMAAGADDLGLWVGVRT